LTALDIKRFALGTPYPATIHALAPAFFTARGYEVVSDRTLNIMKMMDVPKVAPQEIRDFVATLDRKNADAVVLLATDLPCFSVLAELEREVGLPVLTSNQTILWSAMRAANKSNKTTPVSIPDLGKLFHV
jgi:maleate isomerase